MSDVAKTRIEAFVDARADHDRYQLAQAIASSTVHALVAAPELSLFENARLKLEAAVFRHWNEKQSDTATCLTCGVAYPKDQVHVG